LLELKEKLTKGWITDLSTGRFGGLASGVREEIG
jgi:hypothetical protein